MRALRLAAAPAAAAAAAAAAVAAVAAVAASVLWAVPGLAQPTWSVVASPNVRASNYNELDGIAAAGSADAWAVGFARTATPFRALVERWNGTSWSIVRSAPMSSGSDTRLHAVAVVSPADVWAVGSQAANNIFGGLIEHWDGIAWSVVPNPSSRLPGSELLAVSAVSAGDVWAVGDNGAGNALIENWNGRRWSVVTVPGLPSGRTRLLGVAAASATDVWTVGSTGRHPVPVVAHFDGHAWAPVAQPVSGYDSSLRSVAVVTSNDVWAVGTQNLSQTVTEHWDGTSWSLVPSPFPTAGNAQNTLFGVAAIGHNDVWAVGSTLTDFSALSTLTEHWDGATWTLVTSPNPHGSDTLSAVGAAGPGSPLWAVGNNATTIYRTLILKGTA